MENAIDENQSDFRALADRAIDGMVSGLDRHSSYYTPLEYKAFQDDTHRRYLGVQCVRMVDKGVCAHKFSLADRPKRRIESRRVYFGGEWRISRGLDT